MIQSLVPSVVHQALGPRNQERKYEGDGWWREGVVAVGYLGDAKLINTLRSIL